MRVRVQREYWERRFVEAVEQIANGGVRPDTRRPALTYRYSRGVECVYEDGTRQWRDHEGRVATRAWVLGL